MAIATAGTAVTDSRIGNTRCVARRHGSFTLIRIHTGLITGLVILYLHWYPSVYPYYKIQLRLNGCPTLVLQLTAIREFVADCRRRYVPVTRPVRSFRLSDWSGVSPKL
jgi:hypothetical protein